MLVLTPEQKAFLQENFQDADKMIQSNNVDDILLPLDALITYQGFDDGYALTKWGCSAQKMYDEIYLQNTENRDFVN